MAERQLLGSESSESLQTLADLPGQAWRTTSDDVALAAASHNNLLPEPTQIRARRLLSDAQDNLIPLNQNIARVQTILDELHLYRRHQFAQIDLYRSAVTSLRRVPNELLSHIFLLCCSASVTAPYKLDEQHWTLGRVCSKWRQVSLSTPELWSRIHVNHSRLVYGTLLELVGSHGIEPVLHYDTFTVMVKEVLQRSGRVPLSLSIMGNTSKTVNPLEPFIPHLSRIKELCVKQSYYTVNAFLALPSSLVTALHTLDIDGSGHADFDKGAVLRGAPNLRQVAIRRHTVPLAWIHNLPLSQLTRFEIPSTVLRPDQVLNILVLSPNLVECTFVVGDTTHELSSPLTSFSDLTISIVHDLRFFRLTFFGADHDALYLQRLDLPQLRHFVFQTGREMHWDKRWTPTILRSALLETLILKDTIVPPEELERLLRAAPHLIKLDISSGRMITSSILQQMAVGALVPRLMTLRCFVCVTQLEELGALELHLEMLLQRRLETTPASHVQNVCFTLLRGSDGMEVMYGSLEKLKKMNEEGWNIIRVWH